MKTLAGISVAIIIMFIVTVLNEQVLATKISDFLAGWLSCSGYWLTTIIYSERHG